MGHAASPAPEIQVDKETNTEDLFPEEVASLPKGRPGRRAHGSPFTRSSPVVRSQTFSPGARSQYICRLYRSDSDSSMLARKSPLVRNTLERRTLRYKQPCRSSLAALAARTSLDLELDLQASRTRQRQLTEELCDLRELRQRLEDAQLRGHAEPPAWLLRDERFRSLLREAERQTRQTKLDFHQEQAAEKTLKKASKGVCQLRGRNLKEPIQVGADVQVGRSPGLTLALDFYCHTFVIIKSKVSIERDPQGSREQSWNPHCC
ncbi:LOW QUALITY PROTEIN: protein WWC3-like [Tursiops truncatus]|uniref:LOW QUALITY PROTEIN: protein WWC3-like n=1 Tax=Tursiops truncatus TaxID=9739 RepID=UPI003CCF4E9C